ncbi:hypothetical protein Tco_0928825 [Tanacetum coccineum]
MVLNEEWLAGNDEYIERKVLKELKLKRKREEKKSPGRWTRGDEAKDLAEKHKKIKKQQQDTKSSRKIEDKGKERVINVEEDAERKRKIKGKGKEKVVDVEEDAERKRKIKVKGKEKVVDFEEESSWTANEEEETGKRRPKRVQRSILATVERPVQKCQQAYNKSIIRLLKNVFEGDDVSDIDWCSYIIECASVSKLDWATKMKKRTCIMGHEKKTSDIQKLEHKSFKEEREIAELQNDYMGIGEIQDDVGEGEEPNQNELLQLKQRMKDIFKEPDMPEYLSSSSSESDDDNDDDSQLADENEESYRKETHSNDEDDVEIVAEVQKDERNETYYTAECSEKKDEHEIETSKKDEANNNKEEGMANKKDKNQKIVGEVQKDGRNENQNIGECSEKKDEQETGTSKKDEAGNNKEEWMANKKATN